MEDGNANTPITEHIGMPETRRLESHLRWIVRVVIGEDQGARENTPFPDCTFGSLDNHLEDERVRKERDEPVQRFGSGGRLEA